MAALITVVIGGATYVLVSQIQERARNKKTGYYRHFHPDHPSITKPGHSFYYRTY